MEPFILCLEKKAIGHEVGPLHVGNVSEVDGPGHVVGLKRMRLSCCRADCDMPGDGKYWAIE